MKKLDKLILKAFVGPFISTFFITLFVLVMQFFWKYIDDMVGKGLDFFTIMRLTGYVTVTAVVLALPLAVLLSSIMTFGNLGESFELVAIKASGIPLLRFMRPLFFTSILISGTAFLFSNYISPVATLKFTTLLYDIRVAKPAFDIKEGIFYNKLQGYAIKVGRKEKDGDNIYDIVIYENQYALQDNIIIAERGKMSISSDKKFLEFYLQDGWRYQEKGPYNTANTEFYRIAFKDYKKVFDLSSFKFMQTPDSIYKNNFQMLNVRQLQNATDSLVKVITSGTLKRMNREVSSYYTFHSGLDSGWKTQQVSVPAKAKSYFDVLPDSARKVCYMRAMDKINLMKNSLELTASDYVSRSKELRSVLVEWHKKFTLSLACLVLFMIGAPLGSIIRKGGLGLPLVIAVIFFLIFHLLNMFGEKFVRGDITNAVTGMWMSTMVLVPIGIFLTYKAMHDSQLFNKEFYHRFFKSVSNLWKKRITAES